MRFPHMRAMPVAAGAGEEERRRGGEEEDLLQTDMTRPTEFELGRVFTLKFNSLVF